MCDECADERLDHRLRAANDTLAGLFARDLDDPEQVQAYLALIEKHRRNS